MKRKYLI